MSASFCAPAAVCSSPPHRSLSVCCWLLAFPRPCLLLPQWDLAEWHPACLSSLGIRCGRFHAPLGELSALHPTFWSLPVLSCSFVCHSGLPGGSGACGEHIPAFIIFCTHPIRWLGASVILLFSAVRLTEQLASLLHDHDPLLEVYMSPLDA